MREVFHNNDNLEEKDINNVVKRVKLLIINSKNEVLLAFSHQKYQFPGGHVEINETFESAILREVREETGISLKEEDLLDIEPFFSIKYYNKNYPQKNLNTHFIINYYIINTDELYNLDNTEYTEHEKDGNFKLQYINLDNVIDTLMETITWNEENRIIVNEMLAVFEEYKRLKI
jgi:8-oxo-dGTP pyrophosphatase MutT (NUDIX family)